MDYYLSCILLDPVNKFVLSRVCVRVNLISATEYPMTMRLYVQTLPELHDAMYMYYQWVTLRQLVYAVDIRHKCDDPEFEPVTNNEHSIMKVILFDNNSYYALRLMNSIYGEEIPGSLLMFYCPCCLEEFWSVLNGCCAVRV